MEELLNKTNWKIENGIGKRKENELDNELDNELKERNQISNWITNQTKRRKLEKPIGISDLELNVNMTTTNSFVFVRVAIKPFPLISKNEIEYPI